MIKIFLTALGIRWIYAIALFAWMGNSGLIGTDSITYLANAEGFAKSIAAGDLHGIMWLGPPNYTMPLFHWVMAFCALAFGSFTALGFVAVQGVVDAGTCILVARTAGEIDPHFAKATGIAAAINPTQILLTGLVYTDTLFLFFMAAAMFCAVAWLKTPAIRTAALMGVALGAATLVRALAAGFIIPLLVLLVAVILLRRQPLRPVLKQAAAAAVIAGLCIAPALARNVIDIGHWSLTPQGGLHLALWVAPLVKEAKDGTPWQTTFDRNQAEMNRRFPTAAGNIFELSERYTEIAREQLAELGVAAMAKAWIMGAAINLGAPAIILSPPVSQLPRTGFYGTPGDSPVAKIWNFLFHSDNALYAWLLLVGIAGVVVMRAIQTAGVAILVGQGRWAELALFALWTGYILAINGPVASPKYRLPLEIPFVILTGAGFAALSRTRPATA